MKKLLYYSLGIVACCTLGWRGGEVFAQQNNSQNNSQPPTVVSTEQKTKEQIQKEYTDQIMGVLNPMINFFSRSWIILANLAGALMSNDLVYGSVFGLDMFLWKIWSLMRTFANFLIGFGFLRIVLQEVFSFGQSNAVSTVSSKIKNFMIAAVGINVSWFVIGALIDISTILIATIGSFPSIFISNDSTPFFNQTSIQTMRTQLPKAIVMDMSNQENQRGVKRLEYNQGEQIAVTEEQFLDYMMPSYNSLGGPLTFIGASILRLQDFGTLTQQETLKGVSISLIVRIGVVVLFSIALIVLIVVNLMRIGFIWMMVVLSPMIVVIEFLGKDLGIGNILPPSMKREKLTDYIFRPAIVTMFMSIMLIVVVSMSQLMIGNERRSIVVGGVAFEDQQMKVDGLASMETQGDLLPDLLDGTKQGIVGLLLVMLTLYLMYLLIQLSVGKSDLPFVQDLVGKDGLITKGLGSIPVIPGIGKDGKAGGFSLANKIKDRAIQKLEYGMRQGERDTQEALNKFGSYLSGSDHTVRYDAFEKANASMMRDLSTDTVWSDGKLNSSYLDGLRNADNLQELSLNNAPEMGRDIAQWIKKSVGIRLSGSDITVQPKYTGSDGSQKELKNMTLQELYTGSQEGKILLHAIYQYIKNGKFPTATEVRSTALWNKTRPEFEKIAIK